MKISLARKKLSINKKTGERHFASGAIFISLVFMLSIPKPSLSQALPGKPYTLFGNPMCSEWAAMSADAKFAWTSGFLSTLSMGHETSRRVGAQKFKDQQGLDKIVAVIDRHCAANPDAQASEAAAPFLN